MGKKAEIEKLCEQYEVLAETCFSTKFEFYVRSFHCLKSDCFEPGKRGVAMLINNKIKFKTVDIPDLPGPSLEVVAVEIRVGTLNTLLAGIYRHPVNSSQDNSLSKIFALTDNFDNSILLGDFNVHHPIWGAPRANRAGELIADSLDSYPLIIQLLLPFFRHRTSLPP